MIAGGRDALVQRVAAVQVILVAEQRRERAAHRCGVPTRRPPRVAIALRSSGNVDKHHSSSSRVAGRSWAQVESRAVRAAKDHDQSFSRTQWLCRAVRVSELRRVGAVRNEYDLSGADAELDCLAWTAGGAALDVRLFRGRVRSAEAPHAGFHQAIGQARLHAGFRRRHRGTATGSRAL